VTYDLQKPSAQDPYGNVNVALAELTMGAKLKQLNTQVLIVPQTPRLVQVSAQAVDYQNHHDSLQVEASYAQRQVGGRISKLSLQLGKSNWANNAPALFTQDQTG